MPADGSGETWDRSAGKPLRIIRRVARLIRPIAAYPAYQTRAPATDTLSLRRRQVQAMEASVGASTVPKRKSAVRAELPPVARSGAAMKETCLHETGHVVAARAIGVPIDSVVFEYVACKPTGRATTYFAGTPRDARVYLAGPLAEGFDERRFSERAFHALVERRLEEEWRRADLSDFHNAVKALHRGCSSLMQNPNDLFAGWNATAELLRERGSEVTAVASILAAAPGGTISGREIERRLGAQRRRLPVVR